MSNRIYETSSGLNLPSHQANNLNGLKHEYVVVQSNGSAPVFGGQIQWVFKQKNVYISDMVAVINCGAITGLSGTGATNYPNMNPCNEWMLRAEIKIGTEVFQNIYPAQTFIENQLFLTDEQRKYVNMAAGHYADEAQRYNKSLLASNWVISLWTLFKQVPVAVLKENHDITVTMYLDTLANCLSQSTFTGTGNVIINSALLLVKQSKIPAQVVSALHQEINVRPHSYKYLQCKTLVNSSIQTGSTSFNLALSNISGLVGFLYFIVRPVYPSNEKNGAFIFKSIRDFAIVDETGTNMVGGSVISGDLALNTYNRNWTISTFPLENAIGNTGFTGAHVYMYSFCSDPVEAMNTGVIDTGVKFTGKEQLQINFHSALSENHQVDVFGYVQSALELSASAVRRVEL